MQYRQKQGNSTTQEPKPEPKHVFAATRLKEAYFKHRKKKTLSFMTQSSNQLKFAANKAKDVLVSQGVKNVFHVGKSEKEKYAVENSEAQSKASKTVVTQPNTSKNVVLSKIKRKAG